MGVTQMPIQYIKGDATTPQGDGVKIIVHTVDDANAWSGFGMALSRKWKLPETTYHQWFNQPDDSIKPALGRIQMVSVERDIMVANMMAQSREHGNSSIRYAALYECLVTVYNWALYARTQGDNVSVHSPRFYGPSYGSGREATDWTIIEFIIKNTLIAADIPVTIYDPSEHSTEEIL